MQYPEKNVTLKNEKNCIIRSAAAEDAEKVLELLQTVSRQSHYLLYDAAEAATLSLKQERAFLERYQSGPYSLMLLAIVDGVYAGNCSFTVPSRAKMVRHRRELSVMVREEYGGIGIGSELIKTAQDAAKCSGASWMELEVFENNTQAVNLYRSLGFTEYGRRSEGVMRQNGKTECELLMHCRLD